MPVAGGSAGGTDQILAGLVAQATGIDPRQINYIAYSGGGESLAALLGDQVAIGISGIGEYAPLVASGDLKGLAVSGPERVDAVPDVPTLQEEGIGVELSNWRGADGPARDEPSGPGRSRRTGHRDTRHRGMGASPGRQRLGRRVPPRR